MIVSLESSARLDFFTDGDERVASVLLRPRSVVAFADAAYLSLKHGIAAARADTVDDRVCNGAAAGCAVGDVVARAPSRLSVTFRRRKRVARRLDGVRRPLLHVWRLEAAAAPTTARRPLLLGEGMHVCESPTATVLWTARAFRSPIGCTVQAQASYVAVPRTPPAPPGPPVRLDRIASDFTVR